MSRILDIGRWSCYDQNMKILLIAAVISIFMFSLGEAQEFTGLDLNGKTKTCETMKPKPCTKVMTASDHYADKCKEEGKTAIQCDCHDWICASNNH